MRKPIGERIVHQHSDWLRIEYDGVFWTIIPSAIVFTLGTFFNTDIDADQTRITNVKNILKPLSFVSLKYPTYKEIASKLSSFAQPMKPPRGWNHPSHLNITATEVKRMITDCLKTKKYLTVGRNIAQIYFVVNTFLKRQPISAESKWILIIGSDRRNWFSSYMSTSADEEMLEHRTIIPSEGKKKEEKEETLEKRLYERLKDRLKGDK